MTVIIDYDAGNIKSVEKALQSLGETVEITDEAEKILAADRVILPGVGAFGDAMENLNRRNLVPVIKEVVKKKIPFLGICLGLLLLFHSPNYYMGRSYFDETAFVYRSSKDYMSMKKTVLWDSAPNQASIPFPTLLEKFVDISPLLLICPYRVSGKIYIYLYQTHQYTSQFLLRPMFHLHCLFTLYSPRLFMWFIFF